MDRLISYINISSLKTFKYHIVGAFALALTLKWLKAFFSGGICKSKVRLDGKTVIITGANAGIGKETALDMAKRGARVIVACRDVKSGICAADEIRRVSGNGNVVVEYLDLALFDSVKKFAQNINENEEHVHILINNAGVCNSSRKLIQNNIEMTFGVNHLAHFLLTNLLIDKIKKSAPSRIINVSSTLYRNGKMDWDDLMHEKFYTAGISYNMSKLANVLFTRELAKRLTNTGVTTYSLHPGGVRTKIFNFLGDMYGLAYTLFTILLSPLIWFIMKSPREGAQTTIYCAVDENLSKSSGHYYADCKEEPLLPHALSDKDAEKLWDVSENILKDYLK